MAKRHHESKKEARRHEHAGMEKHERGPVKHHKNNKHHAHHGHYEGMSERRKQEMRDAGMIYEDHSQIANLPQEVIMRPYPPYSKGMREGLDDTIRGVDEQVDELDGAKRDKTLSPKKV